MTMQTVAGNGMAPTHAGAAALANKADPATAALSAQAQASIQARYLMARHNPRSWDDVRQRVLTTCTRPAFAEAAIYAKPMGRDKIRGPSVRLAEELARNAGNLQVGAETVYEDLHKRVVRDTADNPEAKLFPPTSFSSKPGKLYHSRYRFSSPWSTQLLPKPPK